MAYQMKPLACDPGKLNGLSENLIVSHYENNYGGAVKRLNAIAAQLAELDHSTAKLLAQWSQARGTHCRQFHDPA
jgi:Fe-Mn family superoxide dismutase